MHTRTIPVMLRSCPTADGPRAAGCGADARETGGQNPVPVQVSLRARPRLPSDAGVPGESGAAVAFAPTLRVPANTPLDQELGSRGSRRLARHPEALCDGSTPSRNTMWSLHFSFSYAADSPRSILRRPSPYLHQLSSLQQLLGPSHQLRVLPEAGPDHIGHRRLFVECGQCLLQGVPAPIQ